MTEEKSPAPVHLWHPPHVSWLTIILALCAVVSFFVISNQHTPYERMGYGVAYQEGYGGAVPPALPDMPMYQDVQSGSGVARATDASVSSAPMMGRGQGGGGVSANSAYSPDYYPYPYPSGNASANDTRELLKVYYTAAMRTRDVQGLTRRVETIVRGHSGRIDGESSSPKSGYVSFVVPTNTYDAFRTELESMVNSRFLTVNIQSSNLLPQKQSIEDQQKQAVDTLAEYQSVRTKLVSAHASTVRSLQSQIDDDAQQLSDLRAQEPTYDIQVQIQTLSDDWSSLKQRLADENALYAEKLKNADANIKYAQDWQKSLTTQDTALLNDVATVNGTVSIEWISLWDMVQLYVPGYWIPAIFAFLAILSFVRDRRMFATV